MERGLLAAALAAGAIVLGAAPAAHAGTDWLCRPGLADDPCDVALDTTTVAADGRATTATPARPSAAERPYDCFYVYPTVSNQLALNADRSPDPEIRAVATFQAARFSPLCRMFAPLYRQSTLAGVLGNALAPSAQLAYSDVRAAFRDYLSQDNGGRGILLLGHSQGAIMLRELVRREIDPDPALRRRLVGAILLGGNVTTRAGAATGGDFTHVPVCTSRGEDGCVVAFSTYSSDPLPGFSFFGNTNTDGTAIALRFPSGPGYEVACTDPGLLSGDDGPVPVTLLTRTFPAGPIAAGIAVTSNGPIPPAPTTWVSGFAYRGACKRINGAHVYRYDPLPGSRRLNEFPPTWGTHLVDFNLGADRLVSVARQQGQTWLAGGLGAGRPVAVRRTGTARLIVTLPGAGRVVVTGRGLRRAAATASAPGPVTLTLRSSRALRRGQSRRIAARVAYVPAGDAAITRPVTVRLTRR